MRKWFIENMNNDPTQPSHPSNLIHHYQATREGKVMLGGCERLMPWEFDTSCSDFENTAPTSQALHQIKSSLQSAC